LGCPFGYPLGCRWHLASDRVKLRSEGRSRHVLDPARRQSYLTAIALALPIVAVVAWQQFSGAGEGLPTHPVGVEAEGPPASGTSWCWGSLTLVVSRSTRWCDSG
jgi:hypothetical protein